MAIQFARCEYVSRSSGGNACRKASYNQREIIACERTGQVFSFKERGGNVHHEILLPEGVDARFRNSEVLWNEAERCEKRKDSQVQKEFVIALPDDKEVSFEDRIELSRRFCRTHFIEKGLGVQLDIHEPHDGEKNWHAHLLVTTRRFSEDGLSFSATKARDLDPIIKSRIVVEADVWGEIWRDLQNSYFEEKGYEVRVDPIGILSQEHLGPVRMRHHLNEAVLRSQMLQKANEKLARDPKSVIEVMTRNQAVFTQKDIEIFLKKHVPFNERKGLAERIVENKNIISLYDKETGRKTKYFTTKEVRAEEEKFLRFADSIANKYVPVLHPAFVKKGIIEKSLSAEQREAYELCVSSGKNLCIIQGRAGSGKSYVLDSVRVAHEASSYRVLGLAPTHKIAADLKTNGFEEVKTCHAFLFAYKNKRERLDSKTVVIVDEAGMLGTALTVELLHVVKSSGAKLVLVGDDRQLSSVERGGAFGFLAENYGAVELKQVRRQKIHWQKEVSENLSQGDVRSAVHLLQENKAVHWKKTKEEALSELLKTWAKDSFLNPHETQQILAQRNIDVDALNQGARDILKQQGRLGELELTCMTQRGKMSFAIGDRIQLTETDKDQGLKSGYFGIIEGIELKTKKLAICLDNKEKVEVDPHTYNGLRHGYAATVYKAQGSTLDRVYVLHSKIINRLVNYVALTRQTKSLSLYVSQKETPNEADLIRQMSWEEGKGTSLIFDTLKDIEQKGQEKTLLVHIKQEIEKVVTKVKDIFHKNDEFYNVAKPKALPHQEVYLSSISALSKDALEAISKGSKRNVMGPTESLQVGYDQKGKDAEAIVMTKEVRLLEDVSRQEAMPFIDAKVVEEALKQNMAEFADDVFASIGEPYHKGSSSLTQRRYGNNGHISVNLKTGAWVNFRDSEFSGGPLHMLTKLKGMSFKEALDYGASWVGLSQAGLSSTGIGPERNLSKTLHHTSQREELQLTEKERLAQEEGEHRARIEKAKALWAKGELIKGTLADRYLKEHRKIKSAASYNLRYLPNYKDPALGKSYPCLMAASRSPTGEVTAVQLTYLDPDTGAKANVPVQKRSLGVLKGSFVILQEGTKDAPLFVAEGIETALSIKEAGVPGTVKASLGLSNIKHLMPESLSQRIIVCADHDEPDSPATKSLEKSVRFLQEKGHLVTVIKPKNLHEDFNDVLKAHGYEGVKSYVRAGLQDTKKLAVDLPSAEKTSNIETPDKAKLIDKILQKKFLPQEEKLEDHDYAIAAKGHISSDLKSVYEDWKHPAFKNNDFYKNVFKKGLKLYGEEEAISYWQSKREDLLNLYEKKIKDVEKMLQSPRFTNLSDDTRALVRKTALEDPDRTLKILLRQISKNEEQEKITPKEKDASLFSNNKESFEDRLKPSQQGQEKSINISKAYNRFKELGHTIANTLHPPVHLLDERNSLGYTLSQDKEFMSTLKAEDKKAFFFIEDCASKHIFYKQREKEGISL